MEPIKKICERAKRKYPNDIKKATDWADKEARKLPNFSEFIPLLIWNALRDMIYDVRNIENKCTKRAGIGQNVYKGGGTKVKSVSVGRSSRVRSASQSWYDLNVGGMRLGSIYGRDLLRIAESQIAVANGHAEVGIALRELKQLVPNDKRVEEAVTNRRIAQIFRGIKKKGGGLGKSIVA